MATMAAAIAMAAATTAEATRRAAVTTRAVRAGYGGDCAGGDGTGGDGIGAARTTVARMVTVRPAQASAARQSRGWAAAASAGSAHSREMGAPALTLPTRQRRRRLIRWTVPSREPIALCGGRERARASQRAATAATVSRAQSSLVMSAVGEPAAAARTSDAECMCMARGDEQPALAARPPCAAVPDAILWATVLGKFITHPSLPDLRRCVRAWRGGFFITLNLLRAMECLR